VHDTARHLRRLEQVLSTHAAHADFAAVEALAAALSAQAAQLGPVPEEPARMVHGDPKISNILFDAAGAVCLIDLDTLGRAPMCLELGDALRSWCNTAAEDSPAASLDPARFEAAVAGYSEASAGLLSEAEWQALPAATHRIAVELAARFLTDALEERYFGWDRRRFASAGAHNRARAAAQLALARSTVTQLDALRRIVDRRLRPSP
jgi:Ser/Thr protein kinase RdoA (MazF antagonist)